MWVSQLDHSGLGCFRQTLYVLIFVDKLAIHHGGEWARNVIRNAGAYEKVYSPYAVYFILLTERREKLARQEVSDVWIRFIETFLR